MKNSHDSENTVFVVLSAAYQEITFVRTGLINDLKSRFKLVLIAPSVLVKRRLCSHFGSGEIEIYVVETDSPKYGDRVIEALLSCKYSRYWGPHRRMRQKISIVSLNPYRRVLRFLICILSKIIPESLLLRVQESLYRDDYVDRLFEQYRPLLTVLSWGGVYGPCPKTIRSARKFSSITISIDASWDCMDEVAVIPKVDRLLVWNEFMKDEAITKHCYLPRNVTIVGPLRCDFYRQEKYLLQKNEFYDSIGLEGNRKLITLVVNRGVPKLYCNVVKKLLSANDEDRLVHPIFIYVRLAPWNKPKDFSEVEDHPLVRIGRSYDFDSPVIVREADIVRSVSLLRYTDVLISVLSTLILESMYSDTPNIALRFPEFRQLYERDFISPLYHMKGVTFVDEIPSLIQAVNRYLADPEEDREGREMILNRLCNGGHGMVKERTLQEIDQILKI